MKLLKSITTPDGGELFTITRDAESIKNKYSDNDYMNAHDINALKGALYQLIRDAQESFEISDAEGFQALISAAICDNKLYLNSFNGHEINHKLNLRALYLNKFNQVVALIEDTDKDDFIYALV